MGGLIEQFAENSMESTAVCCVNVVMYHTKAFSQHTKLLRGLLMFYLKERDELYVQAIRQRFLQANFGM